MRIVDNKFTREMRIVGMEAVVIEFGDNYVLIGIDGWGAYDLHPNDVERGSYELVWIPKQSG